MSALGVIEVIGADTSFSSESARPAVPGVGRAAAKAGRERRPSDRVADSLSDLANDNIGVTLAKARIQAASTPGSTTLALLADAYELAGDRDSAVTVALQALELLTGTTNVAHDDPLAARTSLQVLMRAGRVDEAVRYAELLPINDRLKLEIAAALGSFERTQDAWRIVRGIGDVSGRDAVFGYLFALDGDYRRAAPALRAALREEPDDADTAFNLSIALWSLGAKRKAMAVAMQARAAAPARADIGLHVFELLLIEGYAARVEREVRELLAQGVVPSARLLIVRARAKLALGDSDPALRLLEQASAKAREEDDLATYAEVQSNLIRIRAFRRKTTRDRAIDELLALHEEIPESPIVVVNLAQVVDLKSHAQDLRRATEDVLSVCSEEQAAFLMFQLADLEGDTDAAADHALEWLKLEPDNPRALAAALVTIGIGSERWTDAAQLAITYRPDGKFGSEELNNAAYVFAMAGMSDRAIQLLTPVADQSFVLRATLGLAHLAAGNIDEGMRLYRRAADEADKVKDNIRSLMTAYQALVVRQLGLLEPEASVRVTSISLPPYPLPDDWEDRPEYLRLLAVARRHNFEWPLAI
ncbi:hypothetical protein GCM10025760_16760 [Microbacterium yannicii]|uniref:Tetratricopeptide repeat protein n=1 Tax=Microbacterium yannicii TaxID=671622 RepID=A0ABP9M428_9MICO|nr:tetratricopeptide repeat protein [Microbacterium yannicii]MCO5955109.1 hypothetical protein [Microbacterium yannicii]